MNFFEHQDQARRNTHKLVALFALAIFCLIAITTVFVSFMIYSSQSGGEVYFNSIQAIEDDSYSPLLRWFNPEVCMLVAAVVVGVVVVASLFKWMQLSRGGKAVADAMGGRLIPTNTDTASEKKILNVVEEMAIASGLPVPSVYLLDTPSINAFAAGHNHHDAVIGVTQGCIDLLDRDQLQGVVAHEFSHILNGDMSLNMRLVGVLHGILAIGLLGRLFLNVGRPRYGYSRYRSNSRKNKGSGIALFGLGLIIIGYVGTFFGNLIKANVSRQREYLADASAVQFTRNPEGIGQALQKIGGFSYGSQVKTAASEEFSHLFFGQAQPLRQTFSGWMATHPPLPQRIIRILPQWKGDYPAVAAPMTEARTDEAVASFSTTSATEEISGFTEASAPTTSSANEPNIASAIDSVGQLNREHLAIARQRITEIPSHLKEAARESFSARALVYCLLINENGDQPEQRQQQWQQLQDGCHPVVFRHTQQLFEPVCQLRTELMLPLFESCLASLKTLSPAQHQVFKKNVMLLIRTDKKVSVFEWCLYRMLINNLEPAGLVARNIDLKRASSACEDLLNNICLLGHRTPQAAKAAFNKAADNLTLPLNFNTHHEPQFQHIDQALQTLRRLKPLQKPQLLKALASAIEHDGKVSIAEQELFRAIADNLDCPVPPLQAEQTLS